MVENIDRYQDFENDIKLGSSNSGVSIETALDYHQVDGVTVVTIEDGAISGHGFYGYQNESANLGTNANTRYQAASLSKIVAGLAMAKADRTGLLSSAEKFPNISKPTKEKPFSGGSTEKRSHKTALNGLGIFRFEDCYKM